MRASDVRRRVLEDHSHIRRLLEKLEELVALYEKGDASVREPLRERGLELHDFLCEHLDREDVILAPALLEADAWGEERAQQLAAEHREQRELLAFILDRLRDAERPTALLARELRAFADILRIDMQHEEETELSEAILRDDTVASDVETS